MIKTFSARSNLHPPRASRFAFRIIVYGKQIKAYRLQFADECQAVSLLAAKRQNKRNFCSFSRGGLHFQFSPESFDSFLHARQTQSLIVSCLVVIKSDTVVS